MYAELTVEYPFTTIRPKFFFAHDDGHVLQRVVDRRWKSQGPYVNSK